MRAWRFGIILTFLVLSLIGEAIGVAAPMMQVDDRYELNLTPEKVDRILGGLQ